MPVIGPSLSWIQGNEVNQMNQWRNPQLNCSNGHTAPHAPPAVS